MMKTNKPVYRINTHFSLRPLFAILLSLSFILSSCGSPSLPVTATETSVIPMSTPIPPKPAFETGVYPSLFADYLGKSDEEIQAKIEETWNQLFYGDDTSERVYYPVGSDMAYILDTGSDDFMAKACRMAYDCHTIEQKRSSIALEMGKDLHV
jgi:hypothetical protein